MGNSETAASADTGQRARSVPAWISSDRPWDLRRPRNSIQPERTPTRPQGDVPCIVALVWDEASGEESLVPGRAIRRVPGAVMVMIRRPIAGADRREHELCVWVPESDVYWWVARPRLRAQPGHEARR